MSSTSGAHVRDRSPGAAARRRARTRRRRRLVAVVGVMFVTAGLVVVFSPTVHHAVDELELPLRHDDIIRQQATDKGLDPTLIAAVIYAESRFRDQTSSAGARGLMQITPDTAHFIEKISGGQTFTLKDLSDPQINIAYGSYYLRYLIDRYGSEQLALAAYNAGDANLDRWIAQARAAGHELTVDEIPFAETRGYVHAVETAKAEYRHTYGRQLGH